MLCFVPATSKEYDECLCSISSSFTVLTGVHVPSRDHVTFAQKGQMSCMNRSEEHTSELQSHLNLVCRLLLEKKKKKLKIKSMIALLYNVEHAASTEVMSRS